jgi:ATP-dependent helicase/DNAse subunit B
MDFKGKEININERVFSATEIETLIRCNRAHYYRYIVGLEEESEMILGYDGWLDYMDRGSLLHSVFEKVVKALQDRPMDIKKIIERIILDEFDIIRKENPVLVEIYFDFLRERLLLAVYAYIDKYYKLLQDGVIESSKTELYIPWKDPMEIQIITQDDDIKIKLSGRIDRVDFLSDGSIDIIDYKSGKCFSDSKGKSEVFQDYLYSLAVEKFFDKKVNEARYDFPLELGDKKTWSVNNLKNPDEIKEQKAAMIYDALKRLERGDNSKTTNKKACTYCPYIMICRNPSEVVE